MRAHTIIATLKSEPFIMNLLVAPFDPSAVGDMVGACVQLAPSAHVGAITGAIVEFIVSAIVGAMVGEAMVEAMVGAMVVGVMVTPAMLLNPTDNTSDDRGVQVLFCPLAPRWPCPRLSQDRACRSAAPCGSTVASSP